MGLRAHGAYCELVLSTQRHNPSAAIPSAAKPGAASQTWPQPGQQWERSIGHVCSPSPEAGGLGKAPVSAKTPWCGQCVGPKATGDVQGSFQHTEVYFGKPKATQP